MRVVLHMSRFAFAALASFIGWVIYQADTGAESRLFTLVESLPLGDKLGHIFLFGVLAFLLSLSLTKRAHRLCGWSIHRGSLLVLGFAIVEEFSQQFFATRTPDVGDLIADLTGIFLAELLLRRVKFSWH